MTTQALNVPRMAQMNKRVTLQARSETVDAAGGQAYTWTDKATVWARVEPLSYGQQAYMMQMKGQVTHRVVTRYNKAWSLYWDWLDPTSRVTAGNEHRKNPQMRFWYEGRPLDIKGVQDYSERHGFLEFYCEEKQ